MHRHTKKSVTEDTVDETDNNRIGRRQNQRDRREAPNDFLQGLGNSAASRRDYLHDQMSNFGRYEQQQFQNRLRQYQFKDGRDDEFNNYPSGKSGHRMGAALPSSVLTESIKKRSTSEPPKRGERYALSSISQKVNEASLVSIPEEFQDSDYYGTKSVGNRSLYTGASGSANTSNCELNREDYSEIDATTSTTSGKMPCYSRSKGPAPPPPPIQKSKSAKREDQSCNKQALTNPIRRNRSSTNEFEIETAALDTKHPMYMEPKSNIADENDPYIYEVKGRATSNKNSNSRGFASSTSSFARPSDRNLNYQMANIKVDGGVNLFGRPEEGHLGSVTSSQEMLPLPIELPDSVTDEEAFRRYLSVRRNACNARPVSLQSLAILQQHSNVGSTGDGGAIQRDKNSSSEWPPLSLRQQHLNMHREGHKRTMALSHAIMTLALLCASASQLRFLVAYSHAHSYPRFYYFLVCTCILVEVVVGVGYIVLSRFSFDETRADQVHSYLIFGLFIVAIFNVIICVFAVDDHICEVLWKNNMKNSEYMDSIDQSLQK